MKFIFSLGFSGPVSSGQVRGCTHGDDLPIRGLQLPGFGNYQLLQVFVKTLLLKGIMSTAEYFFKAYTIKSALSVHSLMVFKFLACLGQEKK
jgi:hypothetical protein